MTLCRCGSPFWTKCWRTIFQADSTASEPPPQKNAWLMSPGARRASSVASSIAVGVAVDQLVVYGIVRSCSAAASAISSPWS